jgi:hypothetical protein
MSSLVALTHRAPRADPKNGVWVTLQSLTAIRPAMIPLLGHRAEIDIRTQKVGSAPDPQSEPFGSRLAMW